MELKTIRLDLIDPHPGNPREELTDIPELAASIAELGILQPPAVSSTGGERYIAEFGHRRIAAAKHAGLTEIQVYVKDDDSETAYLALVAENDQQRPLTPAERAKGQQGLLALGDIERAARATGVPFEKLKAAQRGREILDKSKLEQATLDELATIFEFSKDPRLGELEKVVGKPNFANVAAQLTVARNYREESDRLKTLGIPMKEEGTRGERLDYMCDAEGKDIDPKQCETCPAALLASRGDKAENVHLVCDKANAVDGHRYRYGSAPVVETPEEIAEREARAKARTEHEDAVEAAKITRRDFFCALNLEAIGTDKVISFIAAIAQRFGMSKAEDTRSITITADDTPLQVLLALTADKCEYAVGSVCAFITNEYQIRAWGALAEEYLAFLAECGYHLTPVELMGLDRIAELPAEEPEEVCEECGCILEYCQCDETGGDDDKATVEEVSTEPTVDTSLIVETEAQVTAPDEVSIEAQAVAHLPEAVRIIGGVWQPSVPAPELAEKLDIEVAVAERMLQMMVEHGWIKEPGAEGGDVYIYTANYPGNIHVKSHSPSIHPKHKGDRPHYMPLLLKAGATEFEAYDTIETTAGDDFGDCTLDTTTDITFSSTAASSLWKRALDEVTAKLNLKAIGTVHYDIHLTLTIADVSTEAATVRFTVAGAPGKFPTDAIAIANKLAVVGGCTFDAPTQGLGGIWVFEALLEAQDDCTADCDACPADLIPGAEDLTPAEALTAESNPFADVRISKDLAKMDADRMIEELDNGKVISLMHWDGDVVYQVSTHSELGNPDAPKVAYVAAHSRRPIGAAIADARIFADRYAKAHDLDTAGLTVENSTITLKFTAKGGEAS